MHVVVIGSGGYVGTPLCRRLEANGHKVMRIDLGVYGQELHPETRPQMDWDPNADVVVDLAAYAHDPKGQISKRAMMINNAFRVADIVDWAENRDIRVVVASSLSVFAQNGPYPESKRSLEVLVGGRRHVKVLRFGTLFGVDAIAAEDAKTFRAHLLLNKMVADGLKGTIYVNGGELQRPVLALNAALDYLIMALAESVPGGTIENYYDTCGRLGEYAELVRELFPNKPNIEEREAVDARDYGWGSFEPEYIEEEVDRLITFIQRHGARVPTDQFQRLYEFVEKQKE
jgi:nucleoside-diphosphate-sugar epimerase